MTRNATLDQLAHEAQTVARHAHIDLDTFLACSQGERARRWVEDYSAADRHNLCCLMLERKYGDWDAETAALAVAHYDARYTAALLAASDRALPPVAAILATAQERFATAQDAGDYPGAAQIARVRQNLSRGAHLTWQLGDLLISSVNTPGAVYTVNRRGCTCPNGQAGKAQCWHVALFDLLLDMQQDAADAADSAAELAQARAELGRRLARARRQVEAA